MACIRYSVMTQMLEEIDVQLSALPLRITLRPEE